MYNTLEEYKIKLDLSNTGSSDKAYTDFIWELGQLDFQLSNYLHFEETAEKFVKKLYSQKTDKINERSKVKLPKYILELFPFDYWAYHLFNGQQTVEFGFENPLEEIRSVILDKSKIRNVEFLTLYIHRPDTLKLSFLSACGY
jgi:hypothetical protein